MTDAECQESAVKTTENVNKKRKNYIVDTNVLLDDPDVVERLRNGQENNVYIPHHVVLELNNHKTKPNLMDLVRRTVDNFLKNPEYFNILFLKDGFKPRYIVSNYFEDHNDLFILDEVFSNNIKDPIMVTNDKIMRTIIDHIDGIVWEAYKGSNPRSVHAEEFTGIVNEPEDINRAERNTFHWKNGKIVFTGAVGPPRVIDFEHKIWKVIPRNYLQNLAFDLMVNPDINIVSIQSMAGYGKSFLSLAVALYLVFEKRLFEKIYISKPMYEVGKELGYLPGKAEDKIAPYVSYIKDLAIKLHKIRAVNRIFFDPNIFPVQFNPRYLEILPLAYIRGMNIENSVVIVDEMQNMSRSESRSLLSRMGENVKCFCLGDVRQIDNPYLTAENNGMNWIVKKFRGKKIYAHLVLKGKNSRGPITDLVIKSGL